MNVLVVGAGNLGSRHLQSIANVKIVRLQIDVVDPDSESLQIAKERYEQVDTGKHDVQYFNSTTVTGRDSYELAVIATNSDIRCKVVKDLLNSKTVTNMVLEKVLFQQRDEYYQIQSLITRKKVRAWVNHPRRMFDFYKALKIELFNAGNIRFNVTVGNWGLACNALHLLDLFSFLSGGVVDKIIFDNLESEVFYAKRVGFLEVSGALSGCIGKNHKFHIDHFMDDRPLLINISSDKLSLHIDEKEGVTVTHRLGQKSNIQSQKIVKFQSELTEIIVSDIFNNEKCELPSYEDGMRLHLLFIEGLTEFINNNTDSQYNCCPIT